MDNLDEQEKSCQLSEDVKDSYITDLQKQIKTLVEQLRYYGACKHCINGRRGIDGRECFDCKGTGYNSLMPPEVVLILKEKDYIFIPAFPRVGGYVSKKDVMEKQFNIKQESSELNPISSSNLKEYKSILRKPKE